MERSIGSVLTCIVVVVGFVTVCVLLLIRPITMTDGTFQLLNILLGVLASQFANVVQYHIGSSSGSKAKDELINAAVMKGTGQ